MDKLCWKKFLLPLPTQSVSIYEQEDETNGKRELLFPESRDRKMFLYIFFSLEMETTNSWRMLTNGG